MQLIDAAEVRRRLPMAAAIQAARATFAAFADGEVTSAARTFHSMPPLGDHAMLGIMPAHVGGAANVLATKVVTITPDNAQRGLPTIHGLINVFDGITGEPLGVVDGTTVTAIRTAAVSALATDLLAAKDATTLAVLGAGVQAREHVAAMREVRDIEHVSLWNRSRERAEQLAEELRGDGLWVQVKDTPGGAAEDAEIVCTCTATSEPILSLADVAKDAHINAVGAFTPTMRELATDLIAKAWVAVDTRGGAREEAGDLLIPMESREIDKDHIRANLAELMVGRVEAPPAGTLTVFKSVGHGAMDAVAARVILSRG